MVGSGGEHSPFGYDGYFYMVIVIGSTFQFAIRISNSYEGRIAQRFYGNGKWHEWYKYEVTLKQI